jgi:hypothetical protein
MIFNLKTSTFIYDEKEKIKPLEDLGFMFEKELTWGGKIGFWKKDNDVKIMINTLSELVKFVEKYGEIIIDGDTIEIYDGYRE